MTIIMYQIHFKLSENILIGTILTCNTATELFLSVVSMTLRDLSIVPLIHTYSEIKSFILM